MEGFVEGDLEAFGNDSWVDTLFEEDIAGAEESSSNDDDSGSTVTGFDILSLGDFDELILKILLRYTRKAKSTILAVG